MLYMKSPKLPFIFALSLSAFAVPLSNAASAKDIFPVPQVVKENASQSIDAKMLSAGALRKYAPLATVFKEKKLTPGGNIAINVEKDGEMLKKMLNAEKIEPRSGAYFLSISPKAITVSAADATGEFYAIQTLARMIEADGKLTCGSVLDWPDVLHRGVVEGYYGRPWTPEARLSQFDFYGKYKINTYIYGPKDDPYHHARWWEPYPKETAELLKKQIKAAHDNHVDFVWAAHVGSIITKPDNAAENMKKLVEKFEMMYALGVRSFGVFFDDIFVHNADLQAEVCNYVVENFVSKKKDVAPIVMCPSQYNKSWSGGDYLDILGDKLHPSIRVMWTGNSVCTDITEDTVDWVSKRIKRPPYIWWNWPVVDYCASALLLGRTYGLAKENKGKYSGFVSNPMDKPEASKIALFGVADYCWNIDDFNSEKSWKAGVKQLFPHYASAMQTLADHSSDQGPNGHGYRREESVDFKPVVDAALAEYKKSGKLSKATETKLMAEFAKMSKDSKKLIKVIPKDNPALWEEVEFWVRALGETGKLGGATVKFITSSDPKKREELAAKAAKFYASREHTMESQAAHADKIGAPHRNPSKVAERIVMPFINEVFLTEWKKLHKQLGGQTVSAGTEESMFKVISDVKQMEKDIAQRDGKYVRVRKYEPITLSPKQYVGIELPEGIYGTYIHLKLNNPDASKNGFVEVSKDGISWTRLKTNNNGAELQRGLDLKQKIRFFRYVNGSGKPMSIKLEEFKFDIPQDAKVSSRAAMTDGDPRSGYTFSAPATLPPEKGFRKTHVFSSHPERVKLASDGSIQINPEKGKSVTIFEIIRSK